MLVGQGKQIRWEHVDASLKGSCMRKSQSCWGPWEKEPRPRPPGPGRWVEASPRLQPPGAPRPSAFAPLHFRGWGFLGPRVLRVSPLPWLGSNHGSLLCAVFDIQIKMKLVWENSVPQKPIIGACGNIYTHGELMESFVAAFKEKAWEFRHEALWAPRTQAPQLHCRQRWGLDKPGGTDACPLITLLLPRGPAFPSRCPALSLCTPRSSFAVSFRGLSVAAGAVSSLRPPVVGPFCASPSALLTETPSCRD